MQFTHKTIARTLRLSYRGLLDLERAWDSFWARRYLSLMGVEYGAGLKSFGLPMARRSGQARIAIGDQVYLVNHNRANPVGVNHACIFAAAEEAIIEIGDNAGLSGVVLSAHERITIGRYTLLGANVKVFDHDFHPLDWQERRNPARPSPIKQPVMIEDDVFIGTGAIILKGVTIGRGAVIGAGAVVTRSVEPYTICAGNPARMISKLGN